MKRYLVIIGLILIIISIAKVEAKGLINIEKRLEFKEGQWLNSYPVEWDYQAELEYLNNKKNKGLATVLATIPSLGHYYAGDWDRGRKFLYAEVIEVIIMMLSFDDDFDYKDPSRKEIIGMISSMAFVGTKSWELLDAYRSVEISNAKLKDNISLRLQRGELKATAEYKF
ncbi:hypothetical protein BX659_13315 [Orenia metallireducens]|uniref:DUF5683 domain-containing protein n=1 Tax=Orenia metallireducens TaxID=1413210 RepID=A0A285H7K2_9FIRM|nr:hypothetical protein [Orenia metallireducens]PRX21122.1 hypothetical protein BX659_13315 [Orenia metallireducens]SNY31523.1 hypothetical protein SAMN06265827_11514 [Orenia metallireducens]